MRKVVFATGLAVGYVLGAKAGVERYESLVRAARGFAERPGVQGVAGVVAAKLGGPLGGRPAS